MGLRTSGSTIPLAVYGLPLGLLVAGELLERIGIAPTLPLYGPGGSLALLLLGVAWRPQRRS
jgi:hypothetical protein